MRPGIFKFLVKILVVTLLLLSSGGPVRSRSPAVADAAQFSLIPLGIKMVAPKEGERVHGVITVEAQVNRPEEIDYVDFLIQEPGAKDRYSWKDFAPPYFWGGGREKLDTTLFEDGPASAAGFCLSANEEKPKAQARVHFVIDNGKPKVRIVSPRYLENIRGNVLLTVDANDPKGLKKKPAITAVRIYVDGTLTASLSKRPFQKEIRTCSLAPGPHSLRAVAEDSEGMTGSDTIMVILDGAGHHSVVDYGKPR